MFGSHGIAFCLHFIDKGAGERDDTLGMKFVCRVLRQDQTASRVLLDSVITNTPKLDTRKIESTI